MNVRKIYQAKKVILEMTQGSKIDFPGGSVVSNLPDNAGDASFIPRSGKSPEEEVATHSSILAWRIPWTEDPVGHQSMELQ